MPKRPLELKYKPTRLGDLRQGAVFMTSNGVFAVKSQYHYSNDPGAQCQCVLLESGEYAHFPEGNMTVVREMVVLGFNDSTQPVAKRA